MTGADQTETKTRPDSTRHFGQLRASTMWAKGNGNSNRQASVLSAVFGRKSCQMNSFLAFFLVFFWLVRDLVSHLATIELIKLSGKDYYLLCLSAFSGD